MQRVQARVVGLVEFPDDGEHRRGVVSDDEGGRTEAGKRWAGGEGSDQTSASDVFASSHIQELFEAIRAGYDLVVIDTPALTQVAYAGELVRHADAALVVVLHGGNVAPVEDVSERLSILNVDTIGYVFNRVPLADDQPRPERSIRSRLGAKPVSASQRAESS